MLYADRIGARLAIGWTMGTAVSALGIYLSVKLDFPTGATMVCTFGLVLVLMALVRPLVPRGRGAAGAGADGAWPGAVHERVIGGAFELWLEPRLGVEGEIMKPIGREAFPLPARPSGELHRDLDAP